MTQPTLNRQLMELGKKPDTTMVYPTISLCLVHMYNAMADNSKDKLDKGLVDVGRLYEAVDVPKYENLRLSQIELHPFVQCGFAGGRRTWLCAAALA